jgi:hypothetical protein
LKAGFSKKGIECRYNPDYGFTRNQGYHYIGFVNHNIALFPRHLPENKAVEMTAYIPGYI